MGIPSLSYEWRAYDMLQDKEQDGLTAIMEKWPEAENEEIPEHIDVGSFCNMSTQVDSDIATSVKYKADYI
ncbi:hypothetical protein DXG01_016936 [Tephrocybe rancida]|nr:hypothetical protein DXG01_016936 [Tephrocybe rancida]